MIRYFIFAFLIILSLDIQSQESNILSDYGPVVAEVEAETGILTGVSIANSIPGYSGSGYVTGFDSDTDVLTVSINIPEQDFYKVVIHYNAPSGDKTQDFRVNNGFYSKVRFPACDTFSFVDAGDYELQLGENTLEIRKDWGWTNIDKFTVYNSVDNVYNFSPVLVDNEATAETKALYDFLLLQFGKRIISGQTHNYFNDLSTRAGKTPLLRVGDFQHFTEGYPYLWVDGGHTFGKSDDGSVDELINWYYSNQKKPLISYQWHWHSPTGGVAGTNTFYTDYTTFDITKAVTPGTDEYDLIIRDIDDIAAQLKKFQDVGIPILWRPLHEAGGGWFWWGAKGPEACVAMYDIIFDRMKNYHQLHNLIWVWSTPEESWYPGNDKVDIIGHDSYPGNYNYGTQKNAFDELYHLTNGEKLIAMTENGPIPDIDDCLNYDAPWSYFMSWADLVTAQNSLDHIIDVYNHPNVLTIESDNSIHGGEWRSTLYPEDWKPGYEDSQGRFLHDFSYAGYRKGEIEIPVINTNITDVTKPPYNADNTGTVDVTAVLQQAINEVGILGGGVIYLPAGLYRIVTPDNADYALKISKNYTVLRGAGPDSTFLLNDQNYMRQKEVINILGSWSDWFIPQGSISDITTDLLKPTRVIPVESVVGFTAGDNIIISNYPTPEFCAEHGMEEYWTQSAIKGVAFKRVIDSIDIEKKLIIIDTPTRYWLKTRDRSRVYHAGQHITECGIENLSIGNTENPKSGWEEEDYTIEGTGAYDAHFSHILKFDFAENCWVKNVHSFKPAGNANDIHLLSNFLLMNMSRNITVDSCNFQKPQYEGGGGNGYMYTLQSNDVLISNSTANDSRHNYDFKYPFSNGNVIHNCRGENSKYSSDFHMYLSMSNLFDAFTVNGDYLESAFRPWGGDAIHGYSSTQSVFFNTYGEAYHTNKNYIIDSRQFGWGYVIGTSGAADNVVRDPVIGTINGFPYDTSPRDFLEGQSMGEDLRPVSLYLDQLDKRINRTNTVRKFNVNIKVLNEETGYPLSESTVRIYGDEQITNGEGIASFNNVYEVFILSAERNNYYPIEQKQFSIFSDTTIIISLKLMDFEIRIKLFDKHTNYVFSGANVTFNSINEVTDESGEVIFNATGGRYDYIIDKLNYYRLTGTVEIISDTLLEFFLERESATIKFKLKDGTTPVNNALVILNNDTLMSNNLGMSTFLNVLVAENYSYTISKSGYFLKEGSLYLVTDTILDIAMESFPEDIQNFLDNGKLRLWPNPVNDILHFSFETYNSAHSLEIIDIMGKKQNIEFINQEYTSLNVKNYPSGIYILKVQTDEYTERLIFIKN